MHSTYLHPRKASTRARLPVALPFGFYFRHPLLGTTGCGYTIPWPKPRPYRAHRERTVRLRRNTPCDHA